MTTQTEEWEKEFDTRFVREDGLMDKYDTDEDGDPIFTSEAIKDFIRATLSKERTRTLAKVEEWVKENKLDNVWVRTPQTGLICRECEGQEDCECAPYNEALENVLHHLQQLKDNK